MLIPLLSTVLVEDICTVILVMKHLVLDEMYCNTIHTPYQTHTHTHIFPYKKVLILTKKKKV